MTKTLGQIIETFFNDKSHCGVLRHRTIDSFRTLVEAWDSGGEAAALKSAEEQGYEKVERKTFGDYDVVLWFYPPKKLYFVSINSGNLNPFSIDAQQSKPTPGAFPFKAVGDQADTWIDQFESLVIGSAVPERNKQYMRFIKRKKYHFVPFYGNDCSYGAIVSRPTVRECADILLEYLLRNVPPF